MVERYPVYKSQVGIASLPSVDFTQLKEEAKNYSSLANAMSKMSSFFAKEAGDAAAIEGAEYGAANPVTKEQIEAANVSGVELEILDDDYTIYGKAAREAAIISGSNNMEAQAKRSFVEIVTSGIQNGTPSGEIQKQLDAVTFGFVDSLMEASPIAAQKLNATLSVSASSAWQSYVNDEITQNSKKQKAHLSFLVDDFTDTELPNLVASGFNIEGGMDAAYKLIKENVMNKTIALRGASDTFTLKMSDALDAAYLLERQNSIAKWITEDDLTTAGKITQLTKGNITDPRIADIYKSLDENEKQKLAVIIRDTITKKYELENTMEDLADKESLKLGKKLQNDFHQEFLFGDIKNAEELLLNIKDNDPNGEIYPTLAAMLNKKDDYRQSDSNTIISFESLLYMGQLNTIDVVKAHQAGNINTPDYEKYIGKVIASEDKKVQSALTYAKKSLNIDDVGIIYAAGKPQTTKQKQIYNVIHNDLTDQYTAIKSMSNEDRIASSLTDSNGNFDALTYIQDKIDVLVKENELNIDKQSFNRVRSLVNDLLSGRIIERDKGKKLLEKTEFSQYTVDDYKDILDTIIKKPKKMNAKIHARHVRLLETLIKEAE